MSSTRKKPQNPTRNFTEFFNWLKNDMDFYPEICIDVGAAYGTAAIYHSFDKALHLVFEPQEMFIPDLEKKLAPYKSEIFQMALMDKPGEMRMTKPENRLASSLMRKVFKHIKDTSVLMVNASTMDIELEGRLKGKKVLLKTDCQGADLLVIKGADKTLQHCDVVIMETSLYRFWGDHPPDFSDIVSYMKSKGFVVIDILDGLFKPSNNALGQIDLVFAKESGPLRPHHNW